MGQKDELVTLWQQRHAAQAGPQTLRPRSLVFKELRARWLVQAFLPGDFSTEVLDIRKWKDKDLQM